MMYKIGGTELDPQPTTARWIPRKIKGIDGNGRPIYESTRKYELTWGVLDPEEYDDMQDHWLSIGATGSLVVDLPLHTTGSYSFQSYTGCYVYEPEQGVFFAGNYTNVRLLITNIVTEK